MLSSTNKNRIINSYSLVLEDLLCNTDDYEKNVEMLKKIINNLNDISNFTVNPIILNDYKSVLNTISNSVDKNNCVEVFLERILERGYLFLLKDIIENTINRIENKKSIKRIVVMSYNELDDELKRDIEKNIKKQISNSFVDFKINSSLRNGSISFISNGRICNIDLEQLSYKMLNF